MSEIDQTEKLSALKLEVSLTKENGAAMIMVRPIGANIWGLHQVQSRLNYAASDGMILEYEPSENIDRFFFKPRTREGVDVLLSGLKKIFGDDVLVGAKETPLDVGELQRDFAAAQPSTPRYGGIA